MEATVEDQKFHDADPNDYDAQFAADTVAQQDIYANNVAYIQQLLSKYYKMGQANAAGVSDVGAVVAAVKVKFMEALKAYDDQAGVIEQFESSSKQDLTTQADTDPDPLQKAVSDQYNTLMSTVNQKHTLLIHDVRNPSFNDVFDKFVMP